jgi:hypothetical protein
MATHRSLGVDVSSKHTILEILHDLFGTFSALVFLDGI